MKDATKKWSKETEESLEIMVSIFREAVISAAERFSDYNEQKEVTAQCLEVGLYESVMTLNETNKAVMFQRMGLLRAMDLINSLEIRAISDVSLSVIQDIEENRMEEIPEELKGMIEDIKKNILSERNKKDKE